MKAVWYGAFTGLLLLAACEDSTAPPTENATYETYQNTRFNYAIAYPDGLLRPQGEAANSDGQQFISEDGNVEMTVFGRHNVSRQTLDDAYQEALRAVRNDVATDSIAATDRGSDWFVISGAQDDRLFYQRQWLHDDRFVVLDLRYDPALEAKMAPILETIVASFQPTADGPA